MPHFCALVSMYLIILSSAWAKLLISLQASSGGACRSLAALISAPRFSASVRKGTKPFMQSSPPGGPPCGGAWENPPDTGGAPFDGKAVGAPIIGRGFMPLTGGKAESLAGAAAPGRGAGNAPWALACEP